MNLEILSSSKYVVFSVRNSTYICVGKWHALLCLEQSTNRTESTYD